MTRVSTGAEDVFASAGSRYAPSSPLEDIERHLAGHSRFAFVGKPCDVAGLRQLARIDPRVDEKVAYMFAFMCAGVPSHHGTSALLREMGIACDDEVTSFRYRGDGWPGFATAATASGETHRMDYDSSWGGVLNRYLQFRCKICPDGIGEFADVVCADGWYLDEANAPIFDERGGRSIILSRNAKGEALVQSAERAGALQTQPVTIEEIAAMQPYQARRKGLTGARLTAMALLGRRRPRYRGLALAENMKRLGPAKALRELLGTLRRLLRGQGRE
jgi:coenzyme F420 hydrogenase subunit beta